MKVISQFSCGAASAVATKLAIEAFGDVDIWNAFVQEEHPDNRRFLLDCEKWFDRSIRVVREQAHGASAREVFRRRRYLKGPQGAPCTRLLKREVLNADLPPGACVVLGYTADERWRLDQWIDANNDKQCWAPLIDRDLGKPDVLALIERAGIRLPAMYLLGYHNANCIGCVKGGAGYWNKIRRDFPDDFEEMARIEESIGPSARLLRHRSGPLINQRFYLRELDPTTGRYDEEPAIECGASCEMVERSWRELDE